MELNNIATIAANTDDYKDRFRVEYQQLKERCEKLSVFLNKIEAAKVMSSTMTFAGKPITEPKHDCPVELLEKQLGFMREYLHILEVRAVIEDINIF